jgi:hypothetical protein
MRFRSACTARGTIATSVSMCLQTAVDARALCARKIMCLCASVCVCVHDAHQAHFSFFVPSGLDNAITLLAMLNDGEISGSKFILHIRARFHTFNLLVYVR